MTQPTTSFSTRPVNAPAADSADWLIFAARLRHCLLSRTASWAVTAYTASAPGEEDGAAAAAATPAEAGGDEKTEVDAGRTIPLADAAGSQAHSGDSWFLDDLLDQIEAEADVAMSGFADALPPVPEDATPPRKRYRLRPEAALAVVRVAKTFGSAEAMVRALGAPGSVTLITTADPAIDAHLIQLIEHVAQSNALWPRGAPIPVVLTAEKAGSTKPGASDPAVAALSGSLRLALDTRRPAVLIAPAAGTAPKALKVLQPETIALATLDREMLAQLLVDAYPEAEDPRAALTALPTDAPVARITPGDLLLALRWPDPDRAVAMLAAALAPEEVEGAGPGLAEFPLPDEVRGALEQLVDDLQAWKAGEIPWRDVSRGILLAGPPGTGKTETARQVAREAGIGMIAASLATWQARGERSSDLLRAMKADFAKAASEGPCIIFIDEIDVFGDRNRRDHNASWTDYVVGSLLECLDGYAAQEGVVAMAATNHAERIDAALRRPGRFDRILHLRHPTVELMPQALRWQAWPDLRDTDLTAIAAQVAGMSGADIAGMVRAARAKARRAGRPLSVDDLSATLAEIRPAMPDAVRWQVAVHEAGHAMVGAATGVATPRVLALQGDGGVTHAERHVIHQRRAELEAALALDMAGRAAERVVFGEASAGAGGASDSDLARATTMAVAMEAAWGLGDRLTWCGDPETIAPRLRLDPPLAARVEDHLRRAEDRALRILQAQRPVLEAIATALRDKGMLTGPALDELISRVRPEPALQTLEETALEIPGEVNQSGPGDERAANPDTNWSTPYQPLDRAA